MGPGRKVANATGRLFLILGGTMVLIIGKGDLAVIASGLLIALGGIYILSLVSPATKKFMGTGWPEGLCRISAIIAGLLLVASGLVGSIGGMREILVFQNSAGFSILLIGLFPLCWGICTLKLAITGVQS